ncbi:MAG: pilus assembly protein [Actinobacteria bacterium]|nr:pilus assembly protein [Actinomycetota bacterium]
MGRVVRAVGRRRARIEAGERGAALIEAAILMPVVLLIIFGAIEFSSLFKDAATLSSAARAGGRTASAESRNPNMPTDTAAAVGTALSSLPTDSPQRLYVYDATSSSSAPADCSGNCVSFTWDKSSKTFVADSYSAQSPPSWVTNQNVCGGAGAWARVGVWVQADHSFVTNLFGATRTLTSTAIFRMEPLPSSQCG